MDFDYANSSDVSNSLVNNSSYFKRSRYSIMLKALREESTCKQDESNTLLKTLAKLNFIVKKSNSKLSDIRFKFMKNSNDEANI
jgi:hypothetical protein